MFGFIGRVARAMWEMFDDNSGSVPRLADAPAADAAAVIARNQLTASSRDSRSAVPGQPNTAIELLAIVATTSAPHLRVTISTPEPLIAAVPARTTPPHMAVSSGRHGMKPASPLRSNRAATAPASARAKPKPVKKARRHVVPVRKASAQSVRMQAALMKAKRQSDAERALARLAALLPSATIHEFLRKAA